MIEVSLLLSGISVAFAVYFGLANKRRNEKHDTEHETEERAATNAMVIAKLENIGNDVKDIKREYRETRAEVQKLTERVVVVEQSLKSCHKRLDDVKSDQ